MLGLLSLATAVFVVCVAELTFRVSGPEEVTVAAPLQPAGFRRGHVERIRPRAHTRCVNRQIRCVVGGGRVRVGATKGRGGSGRESHGGECDRAGGGAAGHIYVYAVDGASALRYGVGRRAHRDRCG